MTDHSVDFPRLPPDAWSHRLFYEDTGCWSEWRQGREPTFPVANEIEVRPLYAESALAQARAEGYAAGLERAAVMVDLLMKREFSFIGFTDPHPPMTAAEIVAAIRAAIPKQEEQP